MLKAVFCIRILFFAVLWSSDWGMGFMDSHMWLAEDALSPTLPPVWPEVLGQYLLNLFFSIEWPQIAFLVRNLGTTQMK